MKHTYTITGMTCNNCASKVQNALSKVPEITQAVVTLNPPQAVLTMSSHVDTKLLNTTLANAGDYKLIEEGEHAHNSSKPEKTSYFPLYLILFYLLAGIAAVSIRYGSFDIMLVMEIFMGGFFTIFSFFKILNLKGFAEGYSSYDIIAQRWFKYGYIYPFIELALGIAFLSGFNPIITNTAALIVMAVSSVGVIKSLMRKSQIQCACLGTIFNLPLSNITLVEDLLMVVMSVVMLAIYI